MITIQEEIGTVDLVYAPNGLELRTKIGNGRNELKLIFNTSSEIVFFRNMAQSMVKLLDEEFAVVPEGECNNDI